MRRPAHAPGWWTSPSCCCGRLSCGATSRRCSTTIATRFRHVLIDEFQDTNAIQYGWMKLLAGSVVHPFAVGDDDQSIYRWRGAPRGEPTAVPRDFPHAKLFRLEQNYRSTATILNGAMR